MCLAPQLQLSTHWSHSSAPTNQGGTRRSIHQSGCGRSWRWRRACCRIRWHLEVEETGLEAFSQAAGDLWGNRHLTYQTRLPHPLGGTVTLVAVHQVLACTPVVAGVRRAVVNVYTRGREIRLIIKRLAFLVGRIVICRLPWSFELTSYSQLDHLMMLHEIYVHEVCVAMDVQSKFLYNLPTERRKRTKTQEVHVFYDRVGSGLDSVHSYW